MFTILQDQPCRDISISTDMIALIVIDPYIHSVDTPTLHGQQTILRIDPSLVEERAESLDWSDSVKETKQRVVHMVHLNLCRMVTLHVVVDLDE